LNNHGQKNPIKNEKATKPDLESTEDLTDMEKNDDYTEKPKVDPGIDYMRWSD
jgi:hypothetical protein